MKLKVLKNHHWPPDWDFVANDTKNLAQKESRVRLPDQGWQRKLIWLPLEPVSKGSWPHYALCLLWKSPDSTAYSARKGPGLQSWLVSSGLQGTEEPTNRAKTERSFIILQSNQSGNRGSFAIEARSPQRHWGPRFFASFCLFYSDLGFCPQAFSWVMTKWLPQFQRILSSQSHSKMQMKDRFSMHLFLSWRKTFLKMSLLNGLQVLNMGFASMLSS